jgi:glycosyltransferase involved in cell wall biosynthesis
MRICIADYSGHPFQVQLSRELARRGHDVLHLYFSEFQTPKGRLTREASDPATLQIDAVSLGHPFAKYQLLKRRRQEIKVGALFARRIGEHRPDIVIACNLPLDSLDAVRKWCVATSCPFFFWQQDIYSRAIEDILTEKFGLLGRMVGRHYHRLERRAARDSAAVVVIAEDFRGILEREFGVPGGKIHVVENWAPLDEIVPREKSNPWSEANGLAARDVVLYTGTLGMKHNPAQILTLAQRLEQRPNTSVIVISEGPAADWLKAQAAANGTTCLKVLPFQPFDRYPDALGTADVLISILEPEAGVFSVPSKVLSYMCAKRPIVLAAPPENLASKIIAGANAGVAVPAGDTQAFGNAVASLLDDTTDRDLRARNGRAYAERTFDIAAIGGRFEKIIRAAKA